MTTAGQLASESDVRAVTMAEVEVVSGDWCRERQAFVFPDGSHGAFTKRHPRMSDDGKQLLNYRFEEVVI